MAQRLTHLITPGDHYSPLTGSAVPTVVHGLSSATPAGEPAPVVVVARGTYAERYDDAQIVEYDDHAPGPLAGKAMRYVDPLCGAVLGTRPAARRRSRPAIQASPRGDGVILAHNLPQAVPLLHAAGRVSALYAHNQLLGTYTRREASRALDGATAVVAVSDYLAGALSERLPPRLRNRVAVVRNGVDADQFAAPERDDDGVVDVAFIGRVIPPKGVHVLVEAVVRTGHPDIRLTVVGGAGFAPEAPLTPYEESLRRVAAPAGDRIRFIPFTARADVPRLLGAADVTVVPSTWPDPCPLTVLEGAASGAAVVASRIGGIPEIAGPAPGATLVRPGDVDELAEVLRGFAESPASLSRAQTAASAYARSYEASWDLALATLQGALDG